MHFFDSHFHLDLWSDPSKILLEIDANKIYTIAVTNAPSVFQQTLAMTQSSNYVRAALGLHPELVKERYQEVTIFQKHADATRYIGEIGLDYVQSDATNRLLQRTVLSQIIDSCYASRNKVITLHSRKAEEDLLSIIGDGFPGTPILHWYSGPKKLIPRAIAAGFYFSVNLAMTRSKSGTEIIEQIPDERLLTESDGPFVTRSGIPCSPLDIQDVVGNLSKLRKRDPAQMKALIYSNLKRILQEAGVQ